MLDDQTYRERQQAVQQPGTCLYRHTSDRSLPHRRGRPAPSPTASTLDCSHEVRVCCCSCFSVASMGVGWSIGNTKPLFTASPPSGASQHPASDHPAPHLAAGRSGWRRRKAFILPICRRKWWTSLGLCLPSSGSMGIRMNSYHYLVETLLLLSQVAGQRCPTSGQICNSAINTAARIGPRMPMMPNISMPPKIATRLTRGASCFFPLKSWVARNCRRAQQSGQRQP